MMESKSTTLPLGYIPVIPNNGIEPLAKRFSVSCSTTELVRRIHDIYGWNFMRKNYFYILHEHTGIWTQDQRLKRPLLYCWAMYPILGMRFELILMPWKGIILTIRWTEHKIWRGKLGFEPRISGVWARRGRPNSSTSRYIYS
jgi:hypothetical protein